MTKLAYLTIDDAPSPSMDHKIDHLVSKGVPAIWFCTGQALAERPAPALRAIREGFVLGNHAWDHPHFSELPLPECLAQIRRTDALIESLYAEAGVVRPTKCFRFPYGDKGDGRGCDDAEPGGRQHRRALQAHLRQFGYSQPEWEQVRYPYFRNSPLQSDADWSWTFDVLEWAVFAPGHPSGLDSLEKLLARLDAVGPKGAPVLHRGKSAELILMHDHAHTADFFVPLVDRLLRKGTTFALPDWPARAV